MPGPIAMRTVSPVNEDLMHFLAGYEGLKLAYALSEIPNLRAGARPSGLSTAEDHSHVDGGDDDENAADDAEPQATK